MAAALELRRPQTGDAYAHTRENYQRLRDKCCEWACIPNLDIPWSVDALARLPLAHSPGEFYEGDARLAVRLKVGVEYVQRIKRHAEQFGLITIVKVRGGRPLPSGNRAPFDVEVILPSLRRLGELLGEVRPERTSASSDETGQAPRAKTIGRAGTVPTAPTSEVVLHGNEPSPAAGSRGDGPRIFPESGPRIFTEAPRSFRENSPTTPLVNLDLKDRERSGETEIFKSSSSDLSSNLKSRASANPRAEEDFTARGTGDGDTPTPLAVNPRAARVGGSHLRLARQEPERSESKPGEEESSCAEQAAARELLIEAQVATLMAEWRATGMRMTDEPKSAGRLRKLLREGASAEELSLVIVGATHGPEAAWLRNPKKCGSPFAYVFSTGGLRSQYANDGRKHREDEHYAAAHERRKRDAAAATEAAREAARTRTGAPTRPLPATTPDMASTLASSVVGKAGRLVGSSPNQNASGGAVAAPQSSSTRETESGTRLPAPVRPAPVARDNAPPNRPRATTTEPTNTGVFEAPVQTSRAAPPPPRTPSEPARPRSDSDEINRLRMTLPSSTKAPVAVPPWLLECFSPDQYSTFLGAHA